jgi:hypothetical protein
VTCHKTEHLLINTEYILDCESTIRSTNITEYKCISVLLIGLTALEIHLVFINQYSILWNILFFFFFFFFLFLLFYKITFVTNVIYNNE